MTLLKTLSPDEALAEIRRLYFHTTKHTIEDDLAKALALLKAMPTEEQRERATVYMEGLNQMRSDWAHAAKRRAARGHQSRRRRRPGKGRNGP